MTTDPNPRKVYLASTSAIKSSTVRGFMKQLKLQDVELITVNCDHLNLPAQPWRKGELNGIRECALRRLEYVQTLTDCSSLVISVESGIGLKTRTERTVVCMSLYGAQTSSESCDSPPMLAARLDNYLKVTEATAGPYGADLTFGQYLQNQGIIVDGKAWYGLEGRLSQIETALQGAWREKGNQYHALRSKIVLDTTFKPNVVFQYTMPVLNDPESRRMLCNRASQQLLRWRTYHPDIALAGVASRGYPLASILATQFDIPFLPIMERGKGPGKGYWEAHYTEYDTDQKDPKYHGVLAHDVPTHRDVVIMDDVNATGDTARAAKAACEAAGCTVIGFMFITDIPALRPIAQKKLGTAYRVLLPPDADVRYAATLELLKKEEDTAYQVAKTKSSSSKNPSPMEMKRAESLPKSMPLKGREVVPAEAELSASTVSAIPVDSDRVVLFGLSGDIESNQKLIKALNLPAGKIQCKKFANGETSVEIEESCHEKRVYLVQFIRDRYGFSVQDAVFEVILAANAARMSGAREVVAVIPNLPYSRQDKKDRSRACITARVFADMLVSAGVQRVMTFDLHASQIQGFYSKECPVDNLYAEFILTHDLRKYTQGEKMVIVAPDMGAVKRAGRIAKELGLDMACMSKERVRANEVAKSTLALGSVDGCVAVLVDDMADTCGTLVKAVEELIGHGAKRVVAYVIHGVLSGDAVKKVEASALCSLVCTDTVPRNQVGKIRVISLIRHLASAISYNAAGRSLKPHFV